MDDRRQQCLEAFRRAVWYYVRTSFATAKMPTVYHAEDLVSANGRSHEPIWADRARWRADFETVSLRALGGIKKQVFAKRYILAMSISDALRMSGIDPKGGWYKWQAMQLQIAETVGAALLDAGVWPLRSEDGRGYFD